MIKNTNTERDNKIIAIKEIYKQSLSEINNIRIKRDEEIAKILTDLEGHAIEKVLNEIKNMD